MRIFYFLAIYVVVITGCNHKKLLLTKEALKQSTVDTIEINEENNILLLGEKTNRGPFGDFDYYCFVVKKRLGQSDLSYKINIYFPTISWAYISETELFQGSKASGWFCVKNHKISTPLPSVGKIIDSLKQTNKGYFISERNGHFPFYVNGKEIKSVNYGNLMTKYKKLNFDSLEYKLYKLSSDSFIVVSNDGNQLVNQEDGIYFVPKPGYKVIARYDKQEIMRIVDSVSKLPHPPDELKIKPIEINGN
jgi:hypothetical protein